MSFKYIKQLPRDIKKLIFFSCTKKTQFLNLNFLHLMYYKYSLIYT